jgi:hypothetical protein
MSTFKRQAKNLITPYCAAQDLTNAKFKPALSAKSLPGTSNFPLIKDLRGLSKPPQY